MSIEARQGVVSGRKLGVFGALMLCVAVVVVVTGIASREKGNADLQAATEVMAIPTVAVTQPSTRALKSALEIPGRLEAYSRAPIYARVSGYVKTWSADIGAQVKAGQLLAEIEAPDLDQQLLQARADLASAESAATLSEATLTRRKSLVASNFVSAQEIDERTADLRNRKAAVKAQSANVERLEALAGYKKIVAPFDGVVTARDTDLGALITGGAGSGPPMFVVSDITRLRVYVNVPQSYVPMVKIGAKATLTTPEYPTRPFTATVEASSQVVDVATGTTRMQLALDNKNRELMPGSYASVRIDLERETQPLHIPASALIFDAKGLRVATVDLQDRIAFRQVTIARDLGRDIEIASGLSADDRVIVTPPDGVAEGDQVRVTGGGGDGKPAAMNAKPHDKG